jgi:hypothetical protein
MSTTATTQATLTPDLVPIRARRRRGLLATGALLASIGALAVVWLVGAAGQRVEVVVVRQEVPYGAALERADLGVARVSVDPGVAVVPAAQVEALVGQVATTRLVIGMVLAPDLVGPAAEPAAGRVLVPIAVPAERMPAGGLRAGDPVLAVDAGSPTDGASTADGVVGPAPAVVPATVVRVGATDVNGTTVVDLTTSSVEGPGLAVAAANGRVALVVQPSGR